MKKKNMFLSIQNNLNISGYTALEGTHQEKKHLIVPVTMIVEGVLSGSHGPLLHTAEEFGKVPDSWNGRPIVIQHPQVNGKYVSANSPGVLEMYGVGTIFNSKLDNNKLKADAWLNIDRLSLLSAECLLAVNAGEPIEVSVGVYTDEDVISGEWNGIKYNAVARNHKPDHLALLPGGTGACSLADGCGIRANSKEKEGEQDGMQEVKVKDSIRMQGYSLLQIVSNIAEGLKEKLEELRNLLYTLDVQSNGDAYKYNYLEEAYDTYLIYCENTKDGEKYYKRNYQYNVGTGSAEFVGDPVEVRKKIEYETVNNNLNTNEEMAEKCTPCVEKRVNELIAHVATKFTESDRTWLETLSEANLDQMIPEEVAAPEVYKLSVEDQAALDFGKKMLAKKKADMTKGIKANTAEGVWPDEVLANMDETMLERVFNSVKKEDIVVDYSLNGGTPPAVNSSAKVEPMMPNLN